MLKRFFRPRPRRGRLTGHVARKLALAVFGVALGLTAVATVAGFSVLRSALIEGLLVDAEKHAVVAIDGGRYPTLEELSATGERLVRITDVAGGLFVNGIGAESTRFGDPPTLTWAEVRLENVAWRLVDGHRHFETFVGPDVLGISNGLLLRIDASDRWRALLLRIAVIAAAGLAAALALAVATLLIARLLVCRPLGAVTAAIEAAHRAPQAPAAHLSRLAGDDEIAGLSRAVDDLLFYVSGLIESELAPAVAAVEQSANAILLCSADGTILKANRAALTLFGVRDLDSVPGRLGGPAFLFDGRPTAMRDLVADGAVSGPGEVVRREQTIPVLVCADTVRDSTGAAIGAFVALVEMTGVVADMRKQVAKRQEAERHLMHAEQTVARLRGDLEACLVVLEHSDGNPVSHPVAIDPAVTIGAWRDAAAARGEIAPDGVVYGELPLLRADPGAARKAFTSALDVVRRRGGAGRVTVIVTWTAEGENARIVIRAGAESDGGQTGTIAGDAEDTTLLVAALAALLRGQGGKLVAAQLGESGNGLVIVLPLEPEAELLQRPDAAAGIAPAA